MGYYIPGPTSNKAQYIVDNYDGKIVTKNEAVKTMSDPTKAVIIVVSNLRFEAAGFMYNQGEFEEFTKPSDGRPKTFVVMDRNKAKTLSNYRGN